MEHVYSVCSSAIPLNFIDNNKSNHSSDYGLYECILERQCKCMCRVSNLNLLAFVSNSDLSSSTNSEYSFNNVYIIDLNLPNEPHLIKSHPSRITAIEWDYAGQKLLIGDVDGQIEVWSRKDYLINQWQLIYKEICFEGETVLSMCWYKNTPNYRINLSKRDQSAPYNEKFSLSKFEPTVKQFGLKAAEGIFCVSNSGLIWSACFCSDGSIITNRQVLGEMQNKIHLVDLNYRKNGDLMIATSNGLVDHPINFYTVSIRQIKPDFFGCGQLMIQCENFNNFFLRSTNDTKHKYITHLKFVTKEESNSILVGSNGSTDSSLQLWELHNRNLQVHKRFLNSNNYDQSNQLNTVKQWIFNSSCNHSQRIVSISVMNSSIYDSGGQQANNNQDQVQPFIVIAYKNNEIRCLLKNNLQLPAITFKLTDAYRTTQQDSKLINLLHVDDMQFTWSGSGLILIDNAAQIFVYKVPSILDHKSELYNELFVVMLLEYSMLNSFDWWDILLTIKPHLIEMICDRFTENFKQFQHTAIQQKYQHKYLAIKGSIYRISNSISVGLNKSGDCYALAMLYSIENLIKMILRSTSTKNPEKEGPVENIQNIIQNNTSEIQLTKIMLILENKDYCVEVPVLQSLQHLNQWVGDLALYLVGSYPQQCQNNTEFPGGGLIHDISAINTIRELLVIIQIWGLLSESCLPVFTKLNDTDVIANLYKLLTKSINFINSNSEPDEHLLEEYLNLPNNVLIPQLDLTLKARGIITPSLYFNEWPLTLHYYKKAPFLSYQSKCNTVDGAINCNLNGKVDVIRRIGLGNLIGSKNTNMRICTRCESISLLQTLIKSPATLAHASTWSKQCLCSGHWKIS